MLTRCELPGWINLRFTAVFGAATALVLVTGLVAAVAAQVAVLGILIAFVLGLLLSGLEKSSPLRPDSNVIEQSFLIARDTEALDHHRRLSSSLARIVQHGDPLFRSLGLEKVGALAAEADEIGSGTIVYQDTETWRIAYEELLRSPGLHHYCSAALVCSPAYWQDEPGRRSMRLNYELQDGGTVSIERTIIVADQLWPWQDYLPTGPIRNWIDEQHYHGILVRLVRLSAIEHEPDLLADFGIYGSRAVGVQQLSPQSKTHRFILSFDFERVREAEERWKRLTVYAAAYRNLLDRPEFSL